MWRYDWTHTHVKLIYNWVKGPFILDLHIFFFFFFTMLRAKTVHCCYRLRLYGKRLTWINVTTCFVIIFLPFQHQILLWDPVECWFSFIITKKKIGIVFRWQSVGRSIFLDILFKLNTMPIKKYKQSQFKL